MTDLSRGKVLPPLERARLSAELLQVRQQLAGGALNPLEKVRASARGLELRQLLGARTDPLQTELEAAAAEVDKHRKLIEAGALTKDVLAALDRHRDAFKAVEDAKVAAAWEAGKSRPIGTANNKPHTIKAADALTPAGAIKADARNSSADSAIWKYQGDIQQLSFRANVKIDGQLAQGAEQAKATLAGINAAKARGFKLRNVRAGRLGTVWVLESAAGGEYLTRAGFEDATNPVFDRPAMPEPAPGFESMQAQQVALATAFIAWLDTLNYEQRHNQGVVSRKIGSTAVADWVRMEKGPLGLFLQYRTPGAGTGIRITGKDFDALIVECRRLANAPEILPEEPAKEEPDAFEAAKDFYRTQLQGQVVQSVIGPVRITGKGWKKSKFGMKEDALKARLVEHIEEILTKGTAGQRRELYKDRTDGMVAFYFIQKEVQVDDQLVTAGVTVGEDAEGNLFYNVAHSAAKGWIGKEGGVLDSAWIKPRFTPDAGEAEASPESVADDDLNIIILAVVPMPKSSTPGRAPAGGTVGLNGEFYKGGTILPTTTLPKGSTSDSNAGTGRQLVEPGVLEEPPAPGAKALFAQIKEFVKAGDGGLAPDATRAVAMIHYLGENGAAQVMAYCKAYNAGKRWILPGESIEPTGANHAPAAPEIIEYTTKSTGKVLRGIIRHDLSRDEAKAIDPHTWRMNGGYFIREKYLQGDTSAIQAAPAPVVLSPEQLAEQQRRDEAQAQERQQQALANQVGKLRAVADKAIADGDQRMNQERKTNTARRAGMAASAYAQGAADEADGRTLHSIADAVEIGAGGPLAQLTSRAQLQTLKNALNAGRYETDKRLTYSEQLQSRGRETTEEDIRNVALRPPLVWASRYRDAAMTIAKRQPKGNSKLIAALTKLSQNREQFPLVADGDIAITRKAHKVLQSLGESWTLKDTMESLARHDRLARMGITNTVELQDACRALLPHLAARKEESAVAKAERAIIGQKVGIDFFPTPAHVAQRMAKLARIDKGDRVLEPSAGNGNLADAAAAAGGTVDVIEISSQLRDILTAKGYTVVDHDFMGFKPEQPYQAILMNPPFSNRQDAAHIMHAFGMLQSGGTLVAIAGEGVFFGQDQKAEQFRAWLDQHGAEVEKLEGGTFQDDKLLAQTSANARLIVLRK